MNRKKLIIAGIVVAGLLGAGMCTLLVISRQGTDLSAFVGTLENDNTGGGAPGAGEDNNGPSAKPGAPDSGSNTTPSVSNGPPIGDDTPGEATPSIRMGRSTVIKERKPDTPLEDGTKALYEVKLAENALDWSKPAQEPVVGDVIEFELLPGRKYRFEVLSVDIYAEPAKIVVHGRLLNKNGTIYMLMLNNKLLLHLEDYDTPCIFNLYAGEETDNKYVVQEIDPDFAPRSTPMHPES